MSDFAAVVLAGGAARRLGGVLKPSLLVGGRPMVVRVLEAVAAARPRIVVGPPELAPLLPAGVRLTREHPPGGGPVAGLAAGVRLLPAAAHDVAVVSADLPFITPTVLSGLRAAIAGPATGDAAIAGAAEVAVLLDGDGRPQWLCALWRRPALDRRLAALGDPTGGRMRDLTRDAAVREFAVTEGAGPPPWFDCDTDEDLRRADEWAQA
jgi:molybdopterin-guanine dinucleotide biosynthesis protein A